MSEYNDALEAAAKHVEDSSAFSGYSDVGRIHAVWIRALKRPDPSPEPEATPKQVCQNCGKGIFRNSDNSPWRHSLSGELKCSIYTPTEAEPYPEQKAAQEPPLIHVYTSTACLHNLHDRCRKNCKFCGAVCRCGCHSQSDAAREMTDEELEAFTAGKMVIVGDKPEAAPERNNPSCHLADEQKRRLWFDEFRPIINAIGEISVQEAMDAIERTL